MEREGTMRATPAEVKAIATSAYIFLTPLVTNYVRMYREAIDPSSPDYCGGFGSFVHERTSATTENRFGVSHATLLHSSTWLDLRSEPWVLSIPTMEPDRVHTVRTSDLWGFVAGEETDDHDGLRVLVSSPTWVGEVPRGVDQVVRGESSFVETAIEVRMREPGDLAQIRSIQQEFVLAPLSSLEGLAPPPAAPPVEWWPVHADVRSTDEFWSVANFALGLTAPHPQDRAMLERIAAIGVGPGQPWNANQDDPYASEAIDEGVDDAITDLMRATTGGSTVSDDCLSRAETDRDYFGRALAALRHGQRPVSTHHADSG